MSTISVAVAAGDPALRRRVDEALWALLVQGAERGGAAAGDGRAPDDAAASSPDLPALDPLAVPPGTVCYAAHRLLFCVDRQRAQRARLGDDDALGDGGEYAVPAFDRAQFDPSVAAGGGAGGDGFARGGCWNCGVRGHDVRQCGAPFDGARVAAARSSFLAATRPDRAEPAASVEAATAAAAALGRQFPRARAGRLSAALRAALGVGRAEPPPFLRRMRRWGYPPGYLAPAPDPELDRHWGYAANGELSAFVASHDGGYHAVWPHAHAWHVRDRGVAAVRAAQQHVAVFTTSTGDDEPEEEGAAEGGVARGLGGGGGGGGGAGTGGTPDAASDGGGGGSGLLDAPIALALRLSPFLPACICGRQLTAEFPGLSVAFAPPDDGEDDKEEGEGEEEAAGAGEGEGEEAGAAPPPAKRARTATSSGGVGVGSGGGGGGGDCGPLPSSSPPPPVPAFKWPIPIAEPSYCTVHRSALVVPPLAVPPPVAMPPPPEAQLATAVVSSGDAVATAAAAAQRATTSLCGGDTVAADEEEGGGDAALAGASRAGAQRRLSRFLVPRDHDALEAAASSASWYAHIGGSTAVGAASPFVEGLRARAHPLRGGGAAAEEVDSDA